MVNHVRTLLLNRDYDKSPGFDFLGEEIVHTGYRQLSLPSYIEEFRKVLFGASPDRAMMNFRLRQYMTVLHASPLEEYVLDLDKRITYAVGEDDEFVDKSKFTPIVTPVGSTASYLSIVGTPQEPDLSGIMRHSFQVEILSGDTIRVYRQTPPVSDDKTVLEMTNNLSQAILLKHSGYSIKVSTYSAGDSWIIDIYNRPSRNLSTLLKSLGKLGEPNFLSLFGAKPAEPYLTFRNLWFDQDESHLRLGSILLAIAYRTEEIRLAQNG